MILLPSFSLLAVLARLSWLHDDDGYNCMQPAIAASNQNMCWRNLNIVEKNVMKS
jgi:hypothetical protein